MATTRWNHFLSWAVATTMAGCLPEGKSSEFRSGMPARVMPPILGTVLWEASTGTAVGRRIAAVGSDVAAGATISLIEGSSGNTLATTVTLPSGVFNLTFSNGYVPPASTPFFLEAVKGLPRGGASNRAGAPVARMRTVVAFQMGSWNSLNSGAANISSATTAVAIAANFQNLSTAQQLALMGKVTGTTFAAGGTAIAQADFDQLRPMVAAALLLDQDPIGSVGYDAAGATPQVRWVRKAGELVIYSTFSPAQVAPGGSFTISGQNFPGPDATPSITVGGLPAATWSVDATRSALVVTIPANGYAGWLEVGLGSSLWAGPFLPVSGTVGTLYASGRGVLDGTGKTAGLEQPSPVAVDSSGSLLFSDGAYLRRLSPSWEATTLVGNGVVGNVDGTGGAAQIGGSSRGDLDPAGNLYFGDTNNVRRMTPGGTVTTLAGNGIAGYFDAVGLAAQFNQTTGVARDATGNLYVCDRYNHRIRKVDTGGVVTTLAGNGSIASIDGSGIGASFSLPENIVWHPTNGNLYVCDHWGHKIRQVTTAGVVTTLAGSSQAFADGTGAAAAFNQPHRLALDGAGNILVAERTGRIRKVTTAGVVTTLAGSGVQGYADGPLLSARFVDPASVAVAPNGWVFLGDSIGGTPYQRLRLIIP